MDRTGRRLQVRADAVRRIQRHRFRHAFLHLWQQYFHLRHPVRTHGSSQKSGIHADTYGYMLIAYFCGLGAFRKIFIADNAGSAVAVAEASYRQLSGLGTDHALDDAGRFLKICVFQVLVHPGHH